MQSALVTLALFYCAQLSESLKLSNQRAIEDGSELLKGPLKQLDFDQAEANTKLSSELKNTLEKYSRVKKQVIYFFGDSLIRNQFAALCGLVSGNKVPHIGAGHGKFLHCDSKEVYALFYFSEGFNAALVKQAISQGHPVPSMVYLHVGTHLLHVHPERPLTLAKFKQLYNYTGVLEDVLTSFQHAAPLAQLSVMTTFSICEGMFKGKWAKIISTASASDQSLSMAARPCASAIAAQGIDKDVAQRVCEQTFFNRAGSMYIRNQIFQTMSNLKDWSGPRPIVADMWKLTDGHCDMCDDGRHYNKMVLNQLATFFTANHLEPSSADTS